ncbi:hypothetical protein BJP40_05465 [Streptomyces sp. CC53]|uniref:DNA/RNA non-specific endonuclease n=1 Tax=Streptomyces sp. CC53 TaxID=1906740 RepID=UPI0008DD4332|nr:DNA/RNA non-specific endonuclease [Streptomyces sp. CC53]OII61424.1 hypothetical protein BJP40_05465 [Streptomyces sp. CC53]
MVGCLVLALTLSACGPGEDDAKGGDTKDAFLQAASALQKSPVIGYSTKAAGATMKMRATRSGNATGTMTFGGIRTDVLTVGEKTYVRWQKGLPGGKTQPGQEDLLKNRWVTGGFAPGMGKTLTPEAVGSATAQQLKQSSTRFPEKNSTVRIGERDAWKASTPTSDVYVTTSAPHRIMRITPRAGKGIPGVPSMPTDLPGLPTELPDLPSDLPTERASRSLPRTALSAPPAVLGQMDLEELDQGDVDEMFDEMIKNTKQLAKNSADLSYQLKAQGQAAFAGCGPASCTVTMTVTSRFVGVNVKPVSNINAVMTVNMTAGGSPVGGCSTTGTLPVNGTGSLSCTNVSPAWSAWYSRASRTPGTHVYAAYAQLIGSAMGEEMVKWAVRQLEKDRKQIELPEPDPTTTSPTPSPSSSSNCTPSYSYGPLYKNRGTSGHAVLCIKRPKGQSPQVPLPAGVTFPPFDRGHLIPESLGGSGQATNLTPIYISKNRGAMAQCEKAVGKLVTAEEPVDYTVTANYAGSTDDNAVEITIRAVGSKGTVISATIPNENTKGIAYC